MSSTFRSALEQKFPQLVDSVKDEMVIDLFCCMVDGIKQKRVLNTVAKHLNAGKDGGRALADTLEEFGCLIQNRFDENELN